MCTDSKAGEAMGQINIQYFDSPYGELILGAYRQQLCLCDWRYRKMRHAIDSRLQQGLNAEFVERNDAVIRQTAKQLTEYFGHQRKVFDIPLLVVGSAFQKRVWDGLLKIPFGQTSTYQELAERMGNKKAVRAVANANGANAISIIIPCHRIIGSNGKLVGYAGGLNAKAELLRLEFDLFN
jgi:methylated-DNA-[protein]-cysteine S-methyltransferase